MKFYSSMVSGFAFVATIYSATLLRTVQAQEPATVSVPFTIDITIPFTVQAGETFESAARSFCERNSLGTDQIAPLRDALQTEFSRIQVRNQISRCFKWQRQYSVAPMKSWGSMPDNMRIQWLEMQCDNVVPVDPPVPVATVSVEMNGSQIPMMLYQGEDVNEVVSEFCAANGIDVAQYGEALRNSLQEQMRLAAETAKQPPASTPKTVERGTFLFAIPVNVDGRDVKLNVHEGDELGPLVENFCAANGIAVAEWGETLKKSVVDTLVGLQQQLLSELNKPTTAQEQQPVAQEQQQERSIVMTVPINLDGKMVPLDLYEGDNLATRVSEFCREYGIKEDEYGQALRNAVLQMYRKFQESRQQEEAAPSLTQQQ